MGPDSAGVAAVYAAFKHPKPRVGTKAYLNARRLNGVHRDLRRAEARRGTVSDVAAPDLCDLCACLESSPAAAYTRGSDAGMTTLTKE